MLVWPQATTSRSQKRFLLRLPPRPKVHFIPLMIVIWRLPGRRSVRVSSRDDEGGGSERRDRAVSDAVAVITAGGMQQPDR
jgi:hypothetical protein